MKQRLAFCLLAPLALLFVSCSMPGGLQGGSSQSSSSTQSQSSSSTTSTGLTLVTDTSRNQAVLVTKSGASIDISAKEDDGSTASATQAVGLALVSSGTGSATGSSSEAIIVGTRKDGNPGAWAYSAGKIQPVIDEDSGTLTSCLPPASVRDGVFRGQWGWVYHVMGISEDGKIIVGYAENKRGFSWGKFQIDPGTTIGVYWRVSRHPVRPYFLVSQAQIIGTFDTSKAVKPGRWFNRWTSWMMRRIFDHLKWFLLDFLTSYLVMVDKNGVHFDSTNNVYLVSGTDQDNNPAVATIDQKGGITITPQTTTTAAITTVAGTGTAGYSGDGGTATSAQLRAPLGVALDSSGNLFIADSQNNRVREVSSGIITTAAGTGTSGYSGDSGSAASAQLNQPSGVAFDSSGNLYIADTINGVIRQVSTSGTISTVAGSFANRDSYAGDGSTATAAGMYRPFSVGVISVGTYVIGDTFNYRVRKVSSGTINTAAGIGSSGYSGDGGSATAAQLNLVYGVAADSSGNFYVADTYNNVIRKVSASGTISTVAGNYAAGAGYSGDGGSATSAQLNQPFGVALDKSGNLYIADMGNNVIRKVSGGTISTVAGTGTAGYTGDGGLPTSAQLNQPYGVAVDSSGALYIADRGNNVIRMVK